MSLKTRKSLSHHAGINLVSAGVEWSTAVGEISEIHGAESLLQSPVPQLIKKSLPSYGTRNFTTVFRRARNLSLS